MKSLLQKLVRPLRRMLEPDFIDYRGSRLPPVAMRCGGQNFADEGDFISTAEREAQRLVHALGLTPESAVLDIGSGPGRLPIGILRTVGEIFRYLGLDVRKGAVDWGNEYIAAEHPSFRFVHVNAQNERYNPGGEAMSFEEVLPVGEMKFDIVYLYSVFSHMNLEDVRKYLGAIREVLKPNGRVFLTTFIEEGVPDFEINPADYKTEWSGALHCVRFERSFFETLAKEHGFAVDGFDYATEAEGQSAVYLLQLPGSR